ncbi:AAA family ATPase [Rhodococcus sp. NPDC049939]|uniref:AAA family ATPase n=1 Tax=Rhodococcus sp. NPDC049939 TaxID=3155511 RepID=UPI0033D1DCBD
MVHSGSDERNEKDGDSLANWPVLVAMADSDDLTDADREAAAEENARLTEAYEAEIRAALAAVPPSVVRVLERLREYGSIAQISDDGGEFWASAPCPVCRSELQVVHYGGSTEIVCDGCSHDLGVEGGVDTALAMGLTPEDLDDIPYVSSTPESSAEERAAAIPVFDHPSAAVREQVRRRWERDEGDRVYKSWMLAQGDDIPFDAGTLGEILDRPEEPPSRIADLIPSDAGTLVVAARKTGKTTFTLNLTHSLITGEKFLGRFDTVPIAKEARVALLNFEVSAAQAARWADEVGIDHDRLLIVNLRGRRNPLGHEADQAILAQLLRDHHVESLIVDPFGRAYTGTDQNSASEVGAWLVNLDRFARAEAGVRDIILPVHAGWNGERTRGSSALEDWADSIINLTTDDTGRRFMRAIGRDVLVDEDQLFFDPATHRLALSGLGGRKEEKERERQTKKDERGETLLPYLVEGARRHPGFGIAELTQWLGSIRIDGRKFDFRSEDMTHASRLAVDRGLIRIEVGTRRKKCHFVTEAAEGIAPWPALPDDPDSAS